MMPTVAPRSFRVERGLVVGGCRVDVATAVPAPGESLSGAARRLAERVVAESVGVPAVTVRVASLLPSGRPIVSTTSGLLPLAVSIAHDRGLVGAAVSTGAGVGIDIIDTSVVRAGLEHWLDERERAAASPAMVWGAKEAAYKAAGIDAVFRPLRVEIEPDGDEAFSWTLRDDFSTVTGSGRFLENGPYRVAVACSHAVHRSSPELPDRSEVVPCS